MTGKNGKPAKGAKKRGKGQRASVAVGKAGETGDARLARNKAGKASNARTGSSGAKRAKPGIRIEKDTMGDVEVPAEALYGAQTARALKNFSAGGRSLPWRFVVAQIEAKEASAMCNADFGVIDKKVADAIVAACRACLRADVSDQFSVDFLQAGAGTSQNMNVNEVIARVASAASGLPIHPNDHVNALQSTNDAFPTAMQVALYRDIAWRLVHAFRHLAGKLDAKAKEFAGVRKSGRTHLQDAVPMTLGDEVSGWAAAARRAELWLREAAQGLAYVPLGGNAVGNGTGAPEGYREQAVLYLAIVAGVPARPAENPFEATQNPNAVMHACSAMEDAAAVLSRICSDIILLSSGPRTGLGELVLMPLQPGSSFMPGKVNPVIPEMARMAAAHAQGCCRAAKTACSHGALELNVSMPVIAYESLDAAQTLANAAYSLANDCVAHMSADRARCEKGARDTLGNATLLSPRFGYAESARLAKMAWDEGAPLDEVVARELGMPSVEARRILGLDGDTGRRPSRRPAAKGLSKSRGGRKNGKGRR